MSNQTLNFQIEKDRIIVRKSTSDFFPSSDILCEVLLDPNYETNILESVVNYYERHENKKFKIMLENMLNYDLAGFNLYFRILGFKKGLKSNINFYEYYEDSKLSIELGGDLLESGEIDLSSAVILVSEVFDLSGVVDYLGWGTWLKFLSKNTAFDSIIAKGYISSPDGEKDLKLPFESIKSFELPKGGQLKLELEENVVLYGTLASSFIIDSLTGTIVLDSRSVDSSSEVDLDKFMLLDELMMELGIKQFFGNLKLGSPKLNKIQEHNFSKFIGEKAKLIKNIGDKLAPNDILAEVEEYNTNESYDLTEMVHFTDANEIVKYLKVLNGELVTEGTLIFRKPNLSGFSDIEIKAQSTGIVDLNSLFTTGEIKILGGKTLKKIECGMHGKLIGVSKDGFVIISDEGYEIEPRFLNFVNVVQIATKVNYISSLSQLMDTKIAKDEWLILDIDDFSNFEKYYSIIQKSQVDGIILNQIPLEFYQHLSKLDLKIVLINGFGKERFGIRLDIAFSRSNWIQIHNNFIILGV